MFKPLSHHIWPTNHPPDPNLKSRGLLRPLCGSLSPPTHPQVLDWLKNWNTPILSPSQITHCQSSILNLTPHFPWVIISLLHVISSIPSTVSLKHDVLPYHPEAKMAMLFIAVTLCYAFSMAFVLWGGPVWEWPFEIWLAKAHWSSIKFQMYLTLIFCNLGHA